MSQSPDVRVLETNELQKLQAQLLRTKQLSEGTLKGKRRLLKKLTGELGAFTPEKQAELEITGQILAMRRQASQLLNQTRQSGQSMQPAPEHSSQLDTIESVYGPMDEHLLESPEAIRPLWEQGFDDVSRRASEGEYTPVSNKIWEGMLAMHTELFWSHYSQVNMKIPQDKSSKPILFTIPPDDATFGGGKYAISTYFVMGGLNAHGAQQQRVTPVWAGLAMCKAHAFHLSKNGHMEELRTFNTEEKFTSAQFKALSDQISSDALIAFMHGVEHCSGGKFFEALQNILQESEITSPEQLWQVFDNREFLLVSRKLDGLFTDEPPLTPQETEERLYLYSQGLAFMLKANMDNNGSPFENVGSYDRAWLRKEILPLELIEYRKLFNEGEISPAAPPPPDTQETAEKSLGEETLEWRARARGALAAIRGEPEMPLQESIEQLRGEMAKPDAVSMRFFEAIASIEQWVRGLKELNFEYHYRRSRTKNLHDPSDRAVVSDALQQLTDSLQLQALHKPRVEDLNSVQIQELLLTIVKAVHSLSLKHLQLSEDPVETTENRAANHLTVHALYTLMRENTSTMLSRSVLTLLPQLSAYIRTQHTAPEIDMLVSFQRGARGMGEHFDLEELAARLKLLPSVSTRDHHSSVSVLRKTTERFSYRMPLASTSDEGPNLNLTHQPEKFGPVMWASLTGVDIPDAYGTLLQSQDVASSALLGAEYDMANDAVVGYSARATVAAGSRIAVPQTNRSELQLPLNVIKNRLPSLLAQKRREINIICPNVPADVIARTLFIEQASGLFAMSPDREIVAHYGDKVATSASHQQMYFVQLNTLGDLERQHFSGSTVHGTFFKGEVSVGGDEKDVGEKSVPPAEGTSEGSSPREHFRGRRMPAICDVLLRGRINASFYWATDETASKEVPREYRSADANKWIVIDLPDHAKQIFVSDSPERTYVYPGLKDVKEYLKSDTRTPRHLQDEGAKQIFWHTQDQFEASLLQAIAARELGAVNTGSVDALIYQHGAEVRERLETLLAKVNDSRSERVTLETLSLSAIRDAVRSGGAQGEPHCGDTVVRELARMAGYENPIPYGELREFYTLLVTRLNSGEHPARPEPEETV